jgi:hypothetical protein
MGPLVPPLSNGVSLGLLSFEPVVLTAELVELARRKPATIHKILCLNIGVNIFRIQSKVRQMSNNFRPARNEEKTLDFLNDAL